MDIGLKIILLAASWKQTVVGGSDESPVGDFEVI